MSRPTHLRVDVREADLANMETDELRPALDLLRTDPAAFAATYFHGGSVSDAPRGYVNVTSR